MLELSRRRNAFLALSLLSVITAVHAADNADAIPVSSSSQYNVSAAADLIRATAKFEYLASHNGQRLQAPNRAHNLRVIFEPAGVRLYDRTRAGSPELAGLSLIRFGRGSMLAPVNRGTVAAAGSRIEIRRDRILEWYENSAAGLEQGFTLDQEPPGDGPLVLELAVAGAQASLHDASVVLTTERGRRLRYGKLFVKDATGKTLNSRLAVPSAERIQLVVQDAGAAYPLVIDPLVTAIPDKILQSNDPDVNGFDAAVFGGKVSSAGDVNGDGFPDVIVGARGFDTPGLLFDEGAVFVFLGSATGIVGSDPATAHAVILGDQAAAEFGTSVDSAGDVNGDGFDDIIVGAPFYAGTFRGDPTLSVKGAAFVFYGGPAGITATSPAMADARIDANQVDAILGFSVAGAGDVNGDGFDDVIVGAPRQGSPTFPPNIPPNQGQGFGGAAVVFHGSAAGITASGFDDADATLLPYPAGFPEPTGGFMGSDVATAGDVNGDGFDDVLVFINGAALFLGSATGIVGADPTTAHAHISGPGFTVSAAGDVNNDGFGDILLGAAGYPAPEPGFSPTSVGAFGVFLGSAAGISATSLSQAQTFVQGDMSGAQLGFAVSAAGDIDNDGFDDIVVAAQNFAGSLLQEGAAYVFRGGLSGITASTLTDAYVRLESGQSEATRRLNRLELDVTGPGDVNNDGFADVALGLGFYDAGELNEGAVFIYHGGPAPINPNQPPVAVAGADQVVVDIESAGPVTITVDGSLSSDPDGFIIDYAWLERETLLGTSPVLTTALPATGDHTLVLTVTDDDGLTRGDVVVVRVEAVDTPLVGFDDFSSAGFAGGIGWSGNWTTVGDVALSSIDSVPTPPQVRLGAGSSLSRAIALPAGATGAMLKFWAKASQFGPADQVAVQISRDGGAFTTVKTFTVGDSDNTYNFYGGTVGDGRITLSWYPDTAAGMLLRFASTASTGLLFVDDIEVRALLVPPGTPLPPPGTLPIANAGTDITVNDNDSDGFEFVVLNGTLSSDADGFIASHQWFEMASGGGTSLLGSGATLGVSFGRGEHTVQLIVTDNDGGSTSDTVLVTVNQALGNNQAPVANAGADITVIDFDGNALVFVHFDGRASTDPDGTVVAYRWTENGGLVSDVATFSVELPTGAHTIELTVTDNQGATNTDIVVATVAANNPAPTVDTFLATPPTITAGGAALLNWTTSGATGVVIDNGLGAVAVDGNATVMPTVTTAYTLTATGSGGTVTSSVTVTVDSPPPAPAEDLSITRLEYRAGKREWRISGRTSIPGPGNAMTVYVGPTVAGSPVLGTASVSNLGTWSLRQRNSSVVAHPSGTISIQSMQGSLWEGISGTGPVPGSNPGPVLPRVDSFTAVPTTINVGEAATLSWTTTAADSVSINNVGQPADGSMTVSPLSTTTYALSATGPGGTTTSSVIVTVNPAVPGPPSVDSFAAVPATITVGETATLSWNTTAADSVSINNVGQPADGSMTVSPLSTTTYALSATGPGGTTTASVTVTVNTAPTPPQGAVSITGPASVNRGDSVSFTVTFVNTGSSTLSEVQLTFGVNPSRRIKNLSPANAQSVGNVSPGGSVTRTWTGRADKDGTATMSAEATSGGVTLDAVTQSLTIIK